MTKLGVKLSFSALAVIVAPLLVAAPAAAEGLPLTPAIPGPPAQVAEPPDCINYPGNIPCNLATLSAAINPF
ncbi:hypothetical protein [Nocardia sp. NPDC003345]